MTAERMIRAYIPAHDRACREGWDAERNGDLQVAVVWLREARRIQITCRALFEIV